jgi:hypothetical protein
MALAGFEPANLGTRGQHANHQTTEAVATYVTHCPEQLHSSPTWTGRPCMCANCINEWTALIIPTYATDSPSYNFNQLIKELYPTVVLMHSLQYMNKSINVSAMCFLKLMHEQYKDVVVFNTQPPGRIQFAFYLTSIMLQLTDYLHSSKLCNFKHDLRLLTSFILCTRHTQRTDKLTECISGLLDDHGQWSVGRWVAVWDSDCTPHHTKHPV